MARQVLLCAAVMFGAVSLAHAAYQQQAPITKSATASATVTIVAIDSTSRAITVKAEDGTEDTLQAGPDVKSFDKLQVGDKVNIKYYESLVIQLRKPGEASNPAGDVVSQATPTTGKIGTTLTRQQTTTVSVISVDPTVPSITVKTADGHTITRKVQDPKNLQGVNPGDKIDLTYTQAALIDVTPAK
jgi:hypothetical protein